MPFFFSDFPFPSFHPPNPATIPTTLKFAGVSVKYRRVCVCVCVCVYVFNLCKWLWAMAHVDFPSFIRHRASKRCICCCKHIDLRPRLLRRVAGYPPTTFHWTTSPVTDPQVDSISPWCRQKAADIYIPVFIWTHIKTFLWDHPQVGGILSPCMNTYVLWVSPAPNGSLTSAHSHQQGTRVPLPHGLPTHVLSY